MKKFLKIIKEPIIYILILCAIVNFFTYKILDRQVTFPDSVTYINASNINFLEGEVSSNRTIGYPILIKLIRNIGGEEELYKNIVKSQYIISFIGLIFFALAIKKITDNKLIQSVATIIIGINPFIIYWNNLILTETLSLMAISILLFCTVSYLKKSSFINGIIIGLLMFVLVMIKPAFIYIVAIYTVFWIFRFFSHKNEFKYNVVGMIAILISIGLLFVYCTKIEKQTGKFGLTTISSLNNKINVLYSKTYKKVENSEITEVIDEYFSNYQKINEANCWEVLDIINKRFSQEEINNYFSGALKDNIGYYAKYCFEKTIKISKDSVGTLYTLYDINSDTEFDLSFILLPINFVHVYYLIIFGFFGIIYKLLKNKKIDYLLSFFVIMILGSLFTTIVGAPFEWQRLSLPMIPILIAYIAYIASKIKVNSNKEGKLLKDWINRVCIEETTNTKLQFFRYIFVGGFAAGINIGALIILTTLNIHYLVSNVIGFILGLLTNYLLSKKFIFSAERNINKTFEILTYAIIGVIGLGIDTLFVWVFTDKIKFYYVISKIISTAIVFVWNFGARKMLYLIINKKEG